MPSFKFLPIEQIEANISKLRLAISSELLERKLVLTPAETEGLQRIYDVFDNMRLLRTAFIASNTQTIADVVYHKNEKNKWVDASPTDVPASDTGKELVKNTAKLKALKSNQGDWYEKTLKERNRLLQQMLPNRLKYNFLDIHDYKILAAALILFKEQIELTYSGFFAKLIGQKPNNNRLYVWINEALGVSPDNLLDEVSIKEAMVAYKQFTHPLQAANAKMPQTRRKPVNNVNKLDAAQAEKTNPDMSQYQDRGDELTTWVYHHNPLRFGWETRPELNQVQPVDTSYPGSIVRMPTPEELADIVVMDGTKKLAAKKVITNSGSHSLFSSTPVTEPTTAPVNDTVAEAPPSKRWWW